MPKVRAVLCHVSVEVAEKKRVCHRNRAEHAIAAGEPCLVIFGGPRRSRKNYCRDCGKLILEQAQQDLSRITSDLLEQASCLHPQLPV